MSSPKYSTRRPNQARSNSSTRLWDSKKESVYKQLCLLLERAGVSVRREELKRGPGWKVVSGSCRALERKLVLMDRALTQDDQIAFLAAKVVEHQVPITSSDLEPFSNAVRSMLAPLVNDAPESAPLS